MNVFEDCDNLDLFLLGELAAADAAAFEAHLDACAACRDSVNEQRWIDALLRSRARAELEPPPTALIRDVNASVARYRRRRQLAACGLAAAAVLLLAVGLSLQLNRQAEPIAAERDLADASAEPPVVTRATFIGGDDVIVVPLASRHPNVTVVRVYPTFRPSYADQASADVRPGIVDDHLFDDINGG